MASSPETALLRALSLNPSTVQISSHGGSGFAATYKINTGEKLIFAKIARSSDAAVQFEGEHTSLNAIHAIVPSLCPRSHAWGQLTQHGGTGAFLATEFVDMNSSTGPSTSGSGSSLARKLADLHTTRAPLLNGGRGFGFPCPTYCGDTRQDNSWHLSWANFFANNKLRDILHQGERDQGADSSLHRLVEDVCERVVPRLLGDGHLGGVTGITSALIHGDLWSGNQSTATFPNRTDRPSEHIVFDPSSFYAHHEYDHGIMTMFGGFDRQFWNEYFAEMERKTGLKGGKTEPVKEYGDRVALYRCFHQLNHWRMFGGGYKGSAVGVLRDLLNKYG